MKPNRTASLAFIFLILIGYYFSRTKTEQNVKINLPKTHQLSTTQPLLNLIHINDVIHYGENLWDILRKHQVAEGDIVSAINEFKKLYNPRDIHAGDHYSLIQDSSNQLITYEYHPDITLTYKIEKDSIGNFIGEVEKRPLDHRIKTLSGTITSTLYKSIRELGESPELIIAFSDIFQWDIDFFVEPQPGDSYKMVYEVYYLDDQFVRYGRILAAQYCLSGLTSTAFYYQDDNGKGGYYNWDGQSFQKTFLKSPLNYRRISSYFSLARHHPILKRVRPHYGIDYAAPTGTPVVAPADGVVIATGYQSGGVGRYLKIRHNNPHFVTLYGHLSAYAKGIKKGIVVQQRQVIGYVGKTGLATGPHLHYTFYENGRPINPLRIKNVSADPLPANRIKKFQQVVLVWLNKLAQIPDSDFAWNGILY